MIHGIDNESTGFGAEVRSILILLRLEGVARRIFIIVAVAVAHRDIGLLAVYIVRLYELVVDPDKHILALGSARHGEVGVDNKVDRRIPGRIAIHATNLVLHAIAIRGVGTSLYTQVLHRFLIPPMGIVGACRIFFPIGPALCRGHRHSSKHNKQNQTIFSHSISYCFRLAQRYRKFFKKKHNNRHKIYHTMR